MSVVVQPAGNGKIATSAASSSPIILPPMVNGESPNFVRVAATGRCDIRFGPSTVSVVSAGYRLNPNQPEIFAVLSDTHFALIDGLDAGVTVNLVPVSVSR